MTIIVIGCLIMMFVVPPVAFFVANRDRPCSGCGKKCQRVTGTTTCSECWSKSPDCDPETLATVCLLLGLAGAGKGRKS